MGYKAYPHVFQPITIGSMTLKNRINFAPMAAGFAAADGCANQEMIDWIGFQARTGVGYITIGDTPIDQERAHRYYGKLDVTQDKFKNGLMLISEEAHRYGCKLAIELSHAGPGANPKMNPKPAFAPSSLPVPESQQNIKVMDKEDLEWAKNRWAECAVRCRNAGFDMVTLHISRDNLLGSFLSVDSNKRTDEYGGSIENRRRFPLEVIKTVREAVGPAFPLEINVGINERTGPGLEFEGTLAFLKEAQKFINLICVSCETEFYDEFSKFISPSSLTTQLSNIEFAKIVKENVNIPVQVAGNINSVEAAEQILAVGKADLVGICRALMAGPDLIKNAMRGEEDKTRPCIGCMDGCGPLYFDRPARCAVNPALGRETRYRFVPRAELKKKVYVIGSGPAGMQAVDTLLQRGHKVTLFEKAGMIGGLLHDATEYEMKHKLRKYKEWFIRRTQESSGAEIRLNTEVTLDLIRQEKPDAVIVATGGNYIKPPLPGIELSNVAMSRDVDYGTVEIGQRVIVCGGGLTGVEKAIQLGRAGKDVTVVDMLSPGDFCKSPPPVRSLLLEEVEKTGVKFVGNLKINGFKSEGVMVEDQARKSMTMQADTAVIAFGIKGDDTLYRQIAAEMPLTTFAAGDCAGAKNIYNAVFSAFNIAVEI